LWGWLIYWVILGGWLALNYYERFVTSELRRERLERRFSEARLNNLRLQLDPHFLFNALNTVSSQLERDPRLARRMIEHLGDLLRLSLDSKDRQEVTLTEELAFLDHYLAIQRIRFGDHLRIETDALATRLLFDGRRCIGVGFRQRGADREARATREVILCGGAVNSPHLLQISGIGSAEHLQSIGVDVVHELPGVGANLQDHYVARISHRVRNAISINQLAHGLRLAREAVRFAATGRGALTFGVTSAQVFCRSRPELASPDLQLLFTPASYDAARFGELERAPGMTVAVCPVRPDSRGTIMARSPDPFAAPVITPNYLSDPNDQRVLNAGMRITRNIFAAPAIAQHSAVETLPGPTVVSDDALADYARRFGTTIFHPVGTCRMGEGPHAVVDARLRVHGIGGLRVIDASVMPTLTTGNTNAPTIMIGEKGATMIAEDAR